MSYNPTIDFIGLIRTTAGGVRTEEMPGLDWLVSAMARAGLVALSVGQTAPVVNQATTFWFKPSLPSWLAEGTLYIWNPVDVQYEVATPALWKAFFGPAGSIFQSLPNANNVIASGTTLAAVQRVAPVNTTVTLPTIATQYLTGKDIMLVDYSTGIVAPGHTILLNTPDGAKIMQRATWQFFSTPDQLQAVRLRPSPDLNAWVFAS